MINHCTLSADLKYPIFHLSNYLHSIHILIFALRRADWSSSPHSTLYSMHYYPDFGLRLVKQDFRALVFKDHIYPPGPLIHILKYFHKSVANSLRSLLSKSP
jgi:hypothetical protein